ncbi:MAG: hypothetical protein R3F14_14035 [Polyangiaceae bacterium]
MLDGLARAAELQLRLREHRGDVVRLLLLERAGVEGVCEGEVACVVGLSGVTEELVGGLLGGGRGRLGAGDGGRREA